MAGKRIGRLSESAGYTALEALTAVGVMGMMVAFTAPSMQRLKATQQLESATSEVSGMLQQVRSRAVAESTPYLVMVQREEVVDGERSAFALIVRACLLRACGAATNAASRYLVVLQPIHEFFGENQ